MAFLYQNGKTQWSRGQRPCLLLQRSKFEARWQLNFYELYVEKMKMNRKGLIIIQLIKINYFVNLFMQTFRRKFLRGNVW